MGAERYGGYGIRYRFDAATLLSWLYYSTNEVVKFIAANNSCCFLSTSPTNLPVVGPWSRRLAMEYVLGKKTFFWHKRLSCLHSKLALGWESVNILLLCAFPSRTIHSQPKTNEPFNTDIKKSIESQPTDAEFKENGFPNPRLRQQAREKKPLPSAYIIWTLLLAPPGIAAI